jgi:hypothetical protein
MALNASSNQTSGSLTNYCAYQDPESGVERIGHLDLAQNTIQPLAFTSGTPLSNLYQVIAVGEGGIIASGEPLGRSTVKLLAPINGRDVLCVGKNYRYGIAIHFPPLDQAARGDRPSLVLQQLQHCPIGKLAADQTFQSTHAD